MPKVILEFKNEDLFDKLELVRTLKATDAYLALLYIRDKLNELGRSAAARRIFEEALVKYDINLDTELQ